MSRQWILAIDQGTTGTRSVVVDAAGRPAGLAYLEHRQITPRPGWAEHDPEEIWRNVESTVLGALGEARISARELAAIGIANQGETVMAWDSESARPLANAIVWQCDRTRAKVERLKRDAALARRVHRTTGLVLDCYFSASKLRWLFDHVPECRRLARKGRLRMGTLDAWLVFKFSRGREFVTDATTASRTLLMDLRKLEWSQEMLGLFGISREWLPRIRPTMGWLGTALLGAVEVPILAGAVDQQAALFGQCCFRAGSAKCTFGTGAFLLMHTGTKPVYSRHGLLTTVACAKPGRTTYALEGGVYVAGAAVNWLRDSLGLISNGAEAAALASSAPDSGGLTFIPSFAGLAAPYWNRTARGLLHGITAATSRAQVVRALFEGIALLVYAVAQAMAKESGRKLKPPLRVDGGLSRNAFLMQFLADLLDMPVEAPECHETTALGIAYLAGLEAGLFKSEAELEARWRCARRWEPSMSASERARHIARHRTAIRRLLDWGG